ncbi:MAG: phosphate ABC transporter substrate-binding protein [Candidatus Thorarchaeota archaeon]
MSFTSRKSSLTIILIILIPIAGISGWLISKSVMKSGETYQLNIEGSTTVFKIIEESSAVFSQYHPGVDVTVSGTGTGAGITALIDGQADIGMASRPVKDEENTSSGGTLKAYAIAKDGLAIIIHASANPLDITLDIARAIFNGTISDWINPLLSSTSLTGTIQVVVREAGSGTRDAFNEIVMGDEKQLEVGSAYVSNAIQKSSNQLIVDAVANNPNYIGYVGLGYIDETVDAVSINGIEPTIETIQDGSYDIQRELYLVTKTNPEGLVKEFINWTFSPEGQSIVVETGFINVAATTEEIY